MAREDAVENIQKLAKEVYDRIQASSAPVLSMPIRSLSNVGFNEEAGYFESLGKEKKRQLTASTIKTFAQTLRLLSLSKQLAETDDEATKREAYYVSKNWSDAKFNEQTESDSIMDDIEGMVDVNRERLGFIPEEKGGEVAGQLIVVDHDFETKQEIKIDCTQFGSGAYSIPSKVDDLRFETKADFVLAIETSGMFQRLAKHKFWKQANCILVSMGGVPTRATRRFIRKLSDDMNIPVYAFTDGDPYGWLNIYRTLKVGSGNAAHINKFFCVPQARFFGITAQDIIDYDLPTHDLKDIDLKRIRDGIKNDPFVQHYKGWQTALQQMTKLKKRAEQQALASRGLNSVMSEYLPAKLENPKSWLP